MFLSFLELLMSFRLFFLLHFTGTDAYPKPLPAAEERACFEAARGADPAAAKKARDRLVLHNLRLVAHVTKKYDTHAESQEDLLSIGTIGLLKAVDSYSPEKKVRFSTYAARCIENELLMKFRSNRKFDRDVSIQELTEEDTEGSRPAGSDPIADDADLQADAEQRLMTEALYRQMKEVLTPRERLVLSRRYGLGGSEEQPQWKVAEKLGVSRSYVSRIEKAAIAKLKRRMDCS